MQITIPVRGKKMVVDTAVPKYNAEVLSMGQAFVVRFGQSVVLAMVEEDGTHVLVEMPKAMWDEFRVEQETEATVAATANLPIETPATQEPPKVTTVEEAKAYVRDWRDKGWPKPGGHIYAIIKKASNNGAAERVTAALENSGTSRHTARRGGRTARQSE